MTFNMYLIMLIFNYNKINNYFMNQNEFSSN